MQLTSLLLSLAIMMAAFFTPAGAYSGMAKLPSDDIYRRVLLAPVPPPRPVYYRPQLMAMNPFFPQMRRMAFSNQV